MTWIKEDDTYKCVYAQKGMFILKGIVVPKENEFAWYIIFAGSVPVVSNKGQENTIEEAKKQANEAAKLVMKNMQQLINQFDKK